MERTLTERDRQAIWHPYTQHKNNLAPIPVVQGKGSLLFDEKGNSYIDAISSWWVSIHGHANPYIAGKIYEQALKLEHVIFTGFTHEPAVELAERLFPLLPGDFSKVFYSDNGSTAVEVAIKMAIQYWRNQEGDAGPAERAAGGAGDEAGARAAGRNGMRTRNKILAFRNAYHGDTFGAMSVSERSVFTAAFGDYLFGTLFIDTPEEGNIEALKSMIAEKAGEIACFIYEPLLQGAGGMKMYEPEMLDELLGAVQAAGILCIADEVLTGFGRTGKLFAGGWLRHKADMICLSKGLTGTTALGVTATTERIFSAFLSDDKTKTLFHGHSFTANPLACAAALASLDLLEKEECRRSLDAIAERHRTFAAKLESYPVVRNVRVLGTVIAFEVGEGRDGYINPVAGAITQESLLNGIYLRPLGNTVYIMPPYCITMEELERVYAFLLGYIARIAGPGAA
ncbi:MAG TPA: aspartate aminotransferase family protein [Puia sp.]|nr:aspartate aminotransferase family protein [Puia sp.]